MTEVNKIPTWARIALALLSVGALAFTIPAFFNPTSNPALADLTPELAVVGSVAGGFLARQLALSLIGLYGAWNATPMAAGLGAFGIFLWNILEGTFLIMAGKVNAASISGIVFAIVAALVLWSAIQSSKTST